mmetsp:Transcript_45696/g.133047  ORF Transcript_45696/g.133047 Transcript_45696/m.133047 type:complete len:214 (+) Transcript_45696:670-1311(+)
MARRAQRLDTPRRQSQLALRRDHSRRSRAVMRDQRRRRYCASPHQRRPARPREGRPRRWATPAQQARLRAAPTPCREYPEDSAHHPRLQWEWSRRRADSRDANDWQASSTMPRARPRARPRRCGNKTGRPEFVPSSAQALPMQSGLLALRPHRQRSRRPQKPLRRPQHRRRRCERKIARGAAVLLVAHDRHILSLRRGPNLALDRQGPAPTGQ